MLCEAWFNLSWQKNKKNVITVINENENGDNETDGREGEGERKINDIENGEDSIDSRVIIEKEDTPTDVTIAEVTGKTAEMNIGDVESDLRLGTKIEKFKIIEGKMIYWMK